MSDYDFHTLSPADFEDLTRDLVQERDGLQLESFKTGNDGGIDFRAARGANQTVLQCKHFARSGYDALLRALKKEKPKLAKLRVPVARYMVATSVALSPADKDEIAEVFGSILATGDILGCEDLNNLLGQFKEVETRHFKLWLASTTVLQQVLHNAEQSQSNFEVERVQKVITRVVRTPAFAQAREKLDRDRVVVIAGPPGVGKSTLADVMLYDHLRAGYRVIVARHSFAEARKLYFGGKAIFHYDDFLGRTYLGEAGAAFRSTIDRSIADFVAFVRENPDTRLVLTTREHLFAQAELASERFSEALLDADKLPVTLGQLKESHRARILYNHIHFSDLSAGHKDALLADEFYLKIIRHEKFSPRVIKWLADPRQVGRVAAKDFQAFVEALLGNPAEIWKTAYRHEIGNAERSLLLALHTLPQPCDLDRLRSAFALLHPTRSQRYNFPTAPEDFEVALRTLAGAFVNLVGRDGVEVLDPSVSDLLNSVLVEHPENAVDLVESAISTDQVWRIWRLAHQPDHAALKSAVTKAPAKLAKGLLNGLATPEDLGAPFKLEDRVATAINIAWTLDAPALAPAARAALGLLEEAWSARHAEIDLYLGAEILRFLAKRSTFCGEDFQAHLPPLTTHLLWAISDDISPSLATSVLSLLDGPKAREAVRSGLRNWLSYGFGDYLRGLRSSSEFERARGDLEQLEERLEIDLQSRILEVQAEWDEFEEHQAQYEDQMADEWRERRWEAQDAKRPVHDLFDSLKSDRD